MADIGLPECNDSDDGGITLGNKSQKTYDEYGNEC